MARVKDVRLVYTYGDTFDDYSVVWQDSAGLPINLAGYTATMKIKDKKGSGAVTLLTLSSGDGLTVTAGAGKIDFSATPTKMKSGSLVPGSVAFYDLQVATSGSADVKTLIAGQIWIDAEISDT